MSEELKAIEWLYFLCPFIDNTITVIATLLSLILLSAKHHVISTHHLGISGNTFLWEPKLLWCN